MIAPPPPVETQPAVLRFPLDHHRPRRVSRARVIAGELGLALLFMDGWPAISGSASWSALVLYAGLMAVPAALFLANPAQAARLYRLLFVATFAAVAFAVNLLAGILAHPTGGAGSLYLLYFVAAGFPVLLFSTRTAVLLDIILCLLFAVNITVMDQWNNDAAGVGRTVASLSPGLLFVVALAGVGRPAREQARLTAEPGHGLPHLADDREGASTRPPDHLLRAEEMAAVRERNRMAQEIHDTLGHHLTVLNVQLEAAIRLFGTDQERSHQQLLKAKESAATALRDVRAALSTLRPQQFEQGSLRVALERMVNTFSSATGLPVDLSISGLVRPLPPVEETVLYRAVQEALTNIQKHARATRASVTLRYSPDATELTVADNGVGSAAPLGGMGLTGIRERVEGVGGTVSIRTKPGAGLILHISLPVAMPSDLRASLPELAATNARRSTPHD